MPVRRGQRTIDYPLKLTGVEGLENDMLTFVRLTQDEWIKYGPGVYDKYRSYRGLEEEVGKMKENLVEEMRRRARDAKRELTDEDIRVVEELPDSVKTGMALAFINQIRQVYPNTPPITELRVEVNKREVVELFKSKLAGWSEGAYLDDEGKPIAFSKNSVNEYAENVSIERVMLPALIHLFKESDMRVDRAGFLLANTSTG